MSKPLGPEIPQPPLSPRPEKGSSAKEKLELRDRVMELLSDLEVAAVASAECAAGLKEGEEFLDLDRLEDGVQQGDGVIPPMTSVLPRRSVRDRTWRDILLELPKKPLASAPVTTRARS